MVTVYIVMENSFTGDYIRGVYEDPDEAKLVAARIQAAVPRADVTVEAWTVTRKKK